MSNQQKQSVTTRFDPTLPLIVRFSEPWRTIESLRIGVNRRDVRLDVV